MANQEKVVVLSTINLPVQWVERLKQTSPRLQINIINTGKPEDVPQDKWDNCEILFTHTILPQPGQAPNLRWIQVHRSSFEHILEHPLMENKDIRFTSISGVNALPAAEFALTSMLTIGHQMPEILSLQRKGEWDAKRLREIKSIELRGSTVGIVGYGSVGRELARLLTPYDVKILASKRDVMNPQDDGYTIEGKGDPEGLLFHRLYPPQAMRSMLRECDYILISVPLTERTHNLLNSEALESLKPSSCLVSVSPPEIVLLDAIANALAEKQIRGVVLDSFDRSSPPQDHQIWKFANAILTPRIAWRSERTLERALTFFAENLHRYREGTGLLNRFDSERGY